MKINKPIQTKSANLVREFLDRTNLHKKDFAQMIGVTLSYVYNLIDENVPFSTRAITLERIAVVMDINPEEFLEYQIPQDTVCFNKNLILIKDSIKENNLSTLDFIKMFERKKRIEIVDILRGAKKIPIDFAQLKEISNILNLESKKTFEMWKERMTEYLKEGGFNLERNKELLDTIFDCIFNKISKNNAYEKV